MLHRYVLTGAPGAGKTALAQALATRGHRVVAEAATDVIAERQAGGEDEPWTGDGFLDAIAALQSRRQREAGPYGPQVYDRSPLCTLALARYLGRAPTPGLSREVERVLGEGVYEREVFLVEPLGFVTPTAARRISLAESLVFGRVHEEVYREHGFDLVPIPPLPIAARADLIEAHITAAEKADAAESP